MRQTILVAGARCHLAILGMLLVLGGPAMAQTSNHLSQSALKQIQALLREKESRTPAQRKLGSPLVYAVKSLRGERIGVDVPMPNGASGLDIDPVQGALVRLRATVTPALLEAIAQARGTVLQQSATFGSILARVPVATVETLAQRSDVQQIRPAPRVRSSRPIGGMGVVPPMLSLASLFRPGGLSFFGSVSSQGDLAHEANLVRQTLGVDGTGVRVGVLSDSAEATPFLIGTGDLPADTVLVPGQEAPDGGGSSEGTAMMEIIHDLAPGAKLFFATAFNGPESFAENILALRFRYGCDVIVDDISSSDEGAFQDTVIARAVNIVRQSGAVYLSSAGNFGNVTHGTAASWEGDFAAGPTFGDFTLHSFGSLAFNPLTSTSGVVTLQWADPFGGSANDYDLFVFDSTGATLLAASTDPQDGSGNPIEEAGIRDGLPPGSLVVVVANSGAAPRALRVDPFDGRFSVTTGGVTVGHNAGASTISVAATAWNSGRRGLRPFVGGATNPTETFSADGPRRIFYQPDGTPITPGNLLFATGGGLVLRKPDVTAADGVSTRTPGFSPFFGTSAAAPHAAAIAALVLSANHSLTPDQVTSILQTTAIDADMPGVDNDSGYGIAMALPAVQAALAARQQ